jgi:hypothetical protein
MHDQPDGTITDDGGSGSGNSADHKDTPLVTIALCPRHRVHEFQCSRSARVEDFLRRDAIELVGVNYARVFVLQDAADDGRVLGYYTLSASLVERDLTGSQLRKRLPGGIPVPMARIGYLGRDDGAAKGIGAILVQDAARRVNRVTDLGIWGLMLDAETEALVKWYEAAGFKRVRPPKEGPHPLVMYGPFASFLPELSPRR